MNKITFLLLALVFNVALAFGQGLELTDKLPNDSKVVVGKLDNGMTYYIKKNSLPEKRAELTLAVNAGSVLETEQQLGLAHFTEHMSFNGSEHFTKNELVTYLESIGMQFGHEVNAYTSFDETVYGIKVPTDSAEYIDKGLLVLYDWACALSLNEEDINAERGVIQEEWRLSQGASSRVQEKMLKAIFHGSLYGERLPIGTMDVVMNFKPEVLRDFYKTWYRPDLMAVIAIGDFDVAQIEAKIKDLFAKIEKPVNPKERIRIDIPDHKETIVSLASDPQNPMTSVQIIYKHPQHKTVTVADYRDDIISMLMSQMISARLAEKSLEPNPPFVQGYAGYSSFIGPKDVYMSMAVLQNDKIENAINVLTTENQRMAQHGFAQTELDRSKNDLLKMIEKQYNERGKQKSEDFIDDYKSNFLPPYSAFPGIEYEYELFKKYVPTITLDDVNNFAKKMVTEENCVIFAMAPEKDGFKLPTEAQMLETYQKALQQKTEPYVDKVSDKPLIADLPAKGKVVKKLVNKDLGFETWTLSNGAKVVIKTTDYKDDEILFSAVSYGGYSKLKIEDNVSAKNAVNVMAESGLADFDATELQKYLSGKNLSVTPYISEVSEGMRGSCGKADLESMLEIVHTYFTKPRFSESAFNSYMEKQKGMIETQMLDPQNAWSDTIRCVLGNYSDYRRPETPEVLSEANFKRMSAIYKQRFSDPCNFTFYFVGNIDKKVAKSLVEKYIASLPTVERNESFVDLGIRPPKGAIEKDVKKAKEQKCVEMIVFHGEVPYTAQNLTEIDAVCKILTTKLLEQIREKEGGVYSIGAYPSSSKVPYESYMIQIFYSCDPGREVELKGKIFDIIKSIQKDGISDDDIAKVIEKKKREHETEVKENRYWKSLIQEVVEENISTDDVKSEDQRIATITKGNMNAAALKYFDFNSYIKVALLPE